MQNYSQLPFVVHIAARSKNRYPRILQNEYAVFKLKCKICIIQKSLPQWECKNEDNCGQPSTSQDKIHSISCTVGREHIQTGGLSSWVSPSFLFSLSLNLNQTIRLFSIRSKRFFKKSYCYDTEPTVVKNI